MKSTVEPLYKPTRSIREYFDSFAHEFSYSCKEDKLAEIANCVYHGYDLYSALLEQWEEHQDRRAAIYKTLCDYIGMLRGNKNNPLYSFSLDYKRFRQKHLKQMVDLFVAEIYGIYRFPRAQAPYYANVKDYYDELQKRHYADNDEKKTDMV